MQKTSTRTGFGWCGFFVSPARLANFNSSVNGSLTPPAPLQVGTPQGVALALFIKQWLVPRQSARRLAGFLHTGDIFSD
jgi:hypothetical protein